MPQRMKQMARVVFMTLALRYNNSSEASFQTTPLFILIDIFRGDRFVVFYTKASMWRSGYTRVFCSLRCAADRRDVSFIFFANPYITVGRKHGCCWLQERGRQSPAASEMRDAKWCCLKIKRQIFGALAGDGEAG